MPRCARRSTTTSWLDGPSRRASRRPDSNFRGRTGIIRDTIDEIDFWGWPSITTTATEHKRKRFHECAAAGAIISNSTRISGLHLVRWPNDLCHHLKRRGERGRTMIRLGCLTPMWVEPRWPRSAAGGRRMRAANTARSGQSRRGLGLARRSTETSCRSRGARCPCRGPISRAVPLSLLADRWGRVRAIVLMAVIWSVATAASAFAAARANCFSPACSSASVRPHTAASAWPSSSPCSRATGGPRSPEPS